jgi:hypothetical protein
MQTRSTSPVNSTPSSIRRGIWAGSLPAGGAPSSKRCSICRYVSSGCPDELDRLRQARLALGIARPPADRRVLVERLAGADRETGALGRQAGQRSGCLGDHGRVIAQDWRRQPGAQLDATRLGGRRVQPRPHERRLAGLAPGVKIVTDIDQVEAGLVGRDRALEQFGWRVLLGSRFPSELQPPDLLLNGFRAGRVPRSPAPTHSAGRTPTSSRWRSRSAGSS